MKLKKFWSVGGAPGATPIDLPLAVVVPGFPRGGGANSQGRGANLISGQKFPKNCIKMKDFGPGGRGRVSLPPLRSANVAHRRARERDFLRFVFYIKYFCYVC